MTTENAIEKKHLSEETIKELIAWFDNHEQGEIKAGFDKNGHEHIKVNGVVVYRNSAQGVKNNG